MLVYLLQALRVMSSVLFMSVLPNVQQHVILTVYSYYLKKVSCNRQAITLGKRPHDIIALLNNAKSFIKGRGISNFL